MTLYTTLYMAAQAAVPVTCTHPDGTVETHEDRTAIGIPGLDQLGNAIGNAVVPQGGQCEFVGAYGRADMLKSAADTITSVSPPSIATDNVASGAAGFLQGNTHFFAIALFIVSIGVAGVKIAHKREHKSLDELFWMLVGMSVFLGIGAAAVQLVVTAGQAFAPWILNNAGAGSFAENFQALFGDIPDPSLGDLGSYLLVGLVWVCTGLQWLILNGVAAGLPIAVGLWPLAASIEAVQSGKPWKNTLTPIIAAMATYQFFVACVYAGAFAEIGTPKGGQAWQGILLLIMACALMPMLIKAFAPWKSPPGTGVSGAALGVGAGLALAR